MVMVTFLEKRGKRTSAWIFALGCVIHRRPPLHWEQGERQQQAPKRSRLHGWPLTPRPGLYSTFFTRSPHEMFVSHKANLIREQVPRTWQSYILQIPDNSGLCKKESGPLPGIPCRKRNLTYQLCVCDCGWQNMLPYSAAVEMPALTRTVPF